MQRGHLHSRVRKEIVDVNPSPKILDFGGFSPFELRTGCNAAFGGLASIRRVLFLPGAFSTRSVAKFSLECKTFLREK